MVRKIDDLGGAVRAIELGFQQREIHEAAYRWQKQVEAEERIVVGVNRFAEGEGFSADVDYVPVKHVRRARGAGPGKVLLASRRTIHVRVEPH